MKYVKVLGIILILLAVLAGIFWQVWGKGFKAQANIGAAFAAKHVCSCLHIAEHSMEHCQNDFVGDDFDSFVFEDDGQFTTAKAPRGLAKATARFEPGLGCAPVEN